MGSLGLVLLGVVAFLSLAQAVVLIALAWQGRKIVSELDDMTGRLERELTPALENIGQLSRNVEVISDLAVAQARRVDEMVLETTARVQEVTSIVNRTVLPALTPVAAGFAAFKGLRTAVRFLRRVRSLLS